jgi:hypothetical protein
MPQPGLEPDSLCQLCRRFGPSLCLPITPLEPPEPPETDHNLSQSITIYVISPYLHISISPYLHISLNIQYPIPNIQYLISNT